MDHKQVLEALKYVRDFSQKRNFSQSVELIINLKDIDLKNTEKQIDLFIRLYHSTGKAKKICALVGPELKDISEKACQNVILLDDFDKYAKDKRLTKKLANQYDYFIAQANLMTKVASSFGRVLGPKGKMPNPKAGCVVPSNANLKPLAEKLQNTVRVQAKTVPLIQCSVGKEDMKDADLAENIILIYNQVLQHLPNESQNIKSVFVKLTMGKAIRIGREYKKEEMLKEKPARKEGSKKTAPKEKAKKEK